MQKGGSKTSPHWIQLIEQATKLLNQALDLAKKGEPSPAPKKKGGRAKTASIKPKVNHKELDFTTPIRAFVKKFSPGMNGAKKFTLLVAYLTEGDASNRIALSDVEKRWNTMTADGLLGMKFNRKYSAEARENDWVNTEKSGLYYLRPAWKEIFE